MHTHYSFRVTLQYTVSYRRNVFSSGIVGISIGNLQFQYFMFAFRCTLNLHLRSCLQKQMRSTFIILSLCAFHSSFGFWRGFASLPVSQSVKYLRNTRLPSTPVAIDANALPDSKRRISEATKRIESNLSKSVQDYNGLKQKIKYLELESAQPQFWDDQTKAQDTLTEVNRLKTMVDRIDSWNSRRDDVLTLLEMIEEDPSSAGKRTTHNLLTIVEIMLN